MLAISKLATLLDGYIDQGDDTVLDLKTNLIWQQEGPKRQMTWQDAKKYCESLSLGGHTKGWRLPNKEELSSLINKRHEPTICPGFQCYDDGWYWSSTSYSGGSGLAWLVYLDSGLVFGGGRGIEGPVYVRAVRRGP
jgi:hypothetical protein